MKNPSYAPFSVSRYKAKNSNTRHNILAPRPDTVEVVSVLTREVVSLQGQSLTQVRNLTTGQWPTNDPIHFKGMVYTNVY